MIGAIAGDVIGSVHEGGYRQEKDFPLFLPASRFTDDTVLTVAIAQAVRVGVPFEDSLRRWGRRYPEAGYGGWFRTWLFIDDAGPYGSYGNGSAMRVSPIGWAFDDPERVMHVATRTAEVTHDHPEGIRGAQAVASAIFLARSGNSKDRIAELLSDSFGYNCSMTLAELREKGVYDTSCQSTIPAVAAAFLNSTDFEDAIRNAVSIGGDADTMAAITGALAEAHYGGVPQEIQGEVLSRLDHALRSEVRAFATTHGVPMIDESSDGNPEHG